MEVQMLNKIIVSCSPVIFTNSTMYLDIFDEKTTKIRIENLFE